MSTATPYSTIDAPPRIQTDYITSTPLLTDMLPGYRAYLIGEQRRPQGVKSYVNHMRRVIAWLGADATLADLNQRAVLRYKAQNGGGQAPSTMVKTLATLRDFAFWASSAGYDFPDPTLGIRRPRRRRPDPRPLHETEIADLLRVIAVPDDLAPKQHFDWVRNRLMIITYLFTGARLTELANLTWMYIRLDAGIIEIKNGKGGKDRVIPIHPALAVELGAVPPERRRPHMALFQLYDGRPGSANSLTHIFNRWLKERLRATLGEDALHIHCHMLRATFANQLIVNDVDLITVQELMGHTNLDTLMHYVKSDVRRKRAGIERLPDSGAGNAALVVSMDAPAVKPHVRPELPQIACAFCGELFTPSLFRPNQRFCGTPCRVADVHAKRVAARPPKEPKAPKVPKGLTTGICAREGCGNSITILPDARPRKYCCNQCGTAHRHADRDAQRAHAASKATEKR